MVRQSIHATDEHNPPKTIVATQNSMACPDVDADRFIGR
jgi:hypothetical protein